MYMDAYSNNYYDYNLNLLYNLNDLIYNLNDIIYNCNLNLLYKAEKPSVHPSVYILSSSG